MKTFAILAAGAAALLGVSAAQAADIQLTRFECGTPRPATAVNERFSDTYAYPGLKLEFVFSCYLIKHDNDYLLWDTGFGMDAGATAPKKSLVDMLAELKLKPEQIKYVGISHYHGDHTGQVGSFKSATLLIGKNDWDAINAPTPAAGVNAGPFGPWKTGGSKVEPLVGDKDVFGDGSVMVLNTPGHTPGHHSLWVKLPQMGNVILMGDLAHFHENYDSNGVPSFNYDRAQTLASLDRVKKLAAIYKATIIIQHDARDVSKLPAFPNAAK